MKDRILQSLHHFGQAVLPKSSTALFNEVALTLGLTPDELRNRAKTALKNLLHNYSFFEVSTIDKFTHRIIRTFARDLKIAQNFEVELNTENLLSEAVNRLLSTAGEDTLLTEVLLEFSFEKIDDGKSWNIAHDLVDIGKLLFQEQHYPHLNVLRKKEIKTFVSFKTKLLKTIKAHEHEIQRMARKALHLITDHGLEYQDFRGGYFPKFMNDLCQGNFDVNFDAAWKVNFETNTLYPNACPQTKKATLDELHPKFIQVFNTIKDRVHMRYFLKGCLRHVIPLALTNEIGKHVDRIKQEQGLLPISEFNTLISQQIKGQPAPFVYERLGERFRHFFIDEFQDTSQMQWENLIPLISNALESENEKGEKGSLFMVGDVKQSIYRWRGGEAEQLLHLNTGRVNPFNVLPHITDLKTNWRSLKAIVHFNNAFFKFAASLLDNPSYQSLFENGAAQETNSEEGGYVEVNFLEKASKIGEDAHQEKVFKTITRILELGHAPEEICVLVRENRHGMELAAFLTEKGMAVTSADALLLKNNREVLFLMALLHYLNDPHEKELRFNLLEFLCASDEDLHAFVTKNLKVIAIYLQEAYGFNVTLAKERNVLDILEEAVHRFDLAPNSNAYINALLDVAQLVEHRNSGSIHDFLEYWSLNRDKLSLPTQEGDNAIKIMSIHRSKGLEFPFVILPYADTVIADKKKAKKLWVPLLLDDFEEFDEVLLSATKNMVFFDGASKSAYLKEHEKSQLDDLNVLYVAMTRAIKGLFVIATTPNSKKGALDNYANLLDAFLKDSGSFDETMGAYRYGQLHSAPHIKKAVAKKDPIPFIYGAMNTNRYDRLVTSGVVALERQKAIAHGNLLHELLGAIYSVDDIEPSLQSHMHDQQDTEILREKLIAVITHPELSTYFNPNAATVYNEVELLDETGKAHRPDKLIIETSGATILDYKTGAASPLHKSQLNGYAQILERMGYLVKKRIVVYLNDQITPIAV